MLVLEQVSKSFAGQPALRDVSLRIPAGEVVVLLGPSGCGKTTLLRIVAGLTLPDTGRVLWQGQLMTDIPVHQRGFGMMFQDYALFPHKNVAQNVVFGLRMAGWPADAMAARLAEVLALVGLTGFETRPVHELSGGEQQRVALARALAPSPGLLLLDEPLGALDRALRERLMGELRQILKRADAARPGGLTAIYVTHDQAEAFAVADRVVVMSAGRVEQVDAPAVLYGRPATPFVARFLGMTNVLPGRVVSQEPPAVETGLGVLALAALPPGLALGQGAQVLIRPEGALWPAGPAAVNCLAARVVAHSFRGRYQQVTLAVGEMGLQFEFEQAMKLPPVGEMVQVGLAPAGIQLLAGE
jgi:ABC-type Fe3+/spermidine/putrescine transport system ATPase subunit